MPPLRRTPSGMPMNTSGMLDRDLLAGHELLEVDVEDLLLERVTLDLADQRLGRRAAERELDDGAAGGDGREQLLELARLERERLRLAGVPVDDGGNATGRAQLARDALASLGARFGAEGCGCHGYRS